MYRSMGRLLACVAAMGLMAASGAHRAAAQSKDAAVPLPPVVVEQSAPSAPAKPSKKKSAKKAAQPATIGAAPAAPVTTSSAPAGVAAARSGSLTVPNTAEARAELEQTPGGVELVPGSAYQGSTPAATIKDALDYVPGVFVQPKWGDDTRLSIRGSGLSRNFHLRGLQLYMDGIPINTADGFGDFQEIDPTAYRYIEVYKGANALRFGANSLGGAINFVMPTGYDADAFGARLDVGSFGFHKLAASSGGVAGPADYFITGTWQEADGFRDHSWGESVRGAMNVGYRLSEDAETRFYLNANWVRQRIPGAVRKSVALADPETAAAINVANDYQRNIDTVRFANKTAVRLAPGTLLEVGAFGVDRHLMHPIFRWLDYRYDDYGGFARLNNEQRIAGHRNRLIVGANVHNGTVDAKQYANSANAQRGALLSAVEDDSSNVSLYAENSFYFLRDVALVAGTQYLHATREQAVNYTSVGDVNGKSEFDLWSPKVGLLWDVDPTWQVFANVSRSAEIPSFGENTAGTPFNARAAGSDLRDRHARCAPELHLGCIAVSRRDRRRAAVHHRRLQHVLGDQRRQHRASGDRGGPRRGAAAVAVRRRTHARQAVAQCGLYLQRLPLRRRCAVGRQRASRSPAAFHPHRAPVQAPVGRLRRPQHRVGAAGILR